MKKYTTSDRLRQIMNDRNLKQIDIINLAKPYCEKYGIKLGRNDLSQYVSGKVEPGQYKLYVLGQALNVNEAWLMGYEVPMERDYKAVVSREEAKQGLATPVSFSPEEAQEKILLKGYRQLDKFDKGIILGQVMGLLNTKKYNSNKEEGDILANITASQQGTAQISAYGGDGVQTIKEISDECMAKTQTRTKVAKTASKILKDNRYSQARKSVAGSALSQTKKK